jgi:hypothetical protein
MGILFVVVWRALLSWMLRPVSEYLSARAAINTVANVAHLGDLLAEMTQTTLYFMTKLISNYLIFIVFLFATIGLLYTTVFPEYFFRKSERIFRRKVILATVVFGVSLCSQIVISYLTPSSPSYLYSSLIFLVAVIITQFLQNAYEESTELQSR